MSYKRASPPPNVCMVLLRSNLVRCIHLSNMFKLGQHSTHIILLPCPGRGWTFTHCDLDDVLRKEANTTGFVWCHLDEAVFVTVAPCLHLMIATTPVQVLQSFLPPLTLGMGLLPLHHVASTLALDQVCLWLSGAVQACQLWQEHGVYPSLPILRQTQESGTLIKITPSLFLLGEFRIHGHRSVHPSLCSTWAQSGSINLLWQKQLWWSLCQPGCSMGSLHRAVIQQIRTGCLSSCSTCYLVCLNPPPLACICIIISSADCFSSRFSVTVVTEHTLEAVLPHHSGGYLMDLVQSSAARQITLRAGSVFL